MPRQGSCFATRYVFPDVTKWSIAATLFLVTTSLSFGQAPASKPAPKPVTFQPAPLSSSTVRLKQAKELLAEFKAAQPGIVADRLRTLYTRKENEPYSKTKAASAERIRERYLKDGHLPTSNGEFPALASVKQLASPFPLQLILKRVHLAYSDLIRECRQKNQTQDAQRYEQEAVTFLKEAGYELKGKIETIDELYYHDFTLASHWVLNNRILNAGHLKISDDREREWAIARINEGLSLGADAASAPMWKTLTAVHKRRSHWEGKANKVGQMIIDGRRESLKDLLVGGLGIVGSEVFRADVYDHQGRLVGNVATELSEDSLNLASRALARAQSRADQLNAAETLHDELWKQYEQAAVPLQHCREPYLRRRVKTLALPVVNDKLTVTKAGSLITVANNGTNDLGLASIIFSASGIPDSDVPRTYFDKIAATEKKATDSRATFSDRWVADKDLVRYRQELKRLQSPIVWDIGDTAFAPQAKVTFGKPSFFDLSKSLLDRRANTTVWIVGDSFQSEIVLSPK